MQYGIIKLCLDLIENELIKAKAQPTLNSKHIIALENAKAMLNVLKAYY